MDVITKHLEVFDDGKFAYIVTKNAEYHSASCLQQIIERKQFRNRKSITVEDSSIFREEKTVRPLIHMLLLGLAELEKNGLSHKNINPSKILIFPDEKKGDIAKIIDFPSVCVLKEHKSPSFLSKFGCQTPFTAPEILEEVNMNNDQVDYNIFGASGDVWALGAIFYYLLCGEHPFKGTTEP